MKMLKTQNKCVSENQTIYLTEKELASRLRISVKLLQKMRLEGGGIPFYKFGRCVRYHLADIQQFESAAYRQSTSDDGSAHFN